MFSIQKSAITLLFIYFDFSPIYKADSGGSWTFSFDPVIKIVMVNPGLSFEKQSPRSWAYNHLVQVLVVF